jgi:hypothetical protein
VKRKRRIEVIRYTRRVTFIEGGDPPAVADELPAINITPVTPEGEDRRPAPGEAAEPQTPRRRPAFRLRDLLRLRKRL